MQSFHRIYSLSTVVHITAGEIYVGKKHEIISTVVGSCIAVCLFDKKNKIGGVNHFMLPYNDQKIKGLPLRYGDSAMKALITEMKKKGAETGFLTAKIFGGGNVIPWNDSPSIGDQNILFIRAYLEQLGIPLLKESVGSNFGRKIYFFTENNKVWVSLIK